MILSPGTLTQTTTKMTTDKIKKPSPITAAQTEPKYSNGAHPQANSPNTNHINRHPTQLFIQTNTD